jgi:hypothetical protein
MAQGITAYRRVQMGAETTPGSAVAATSYWRGKASLQDNRETVFPEEHIGILPGVDRTYVPSYGATVTLEQVEATFEQIPYLFEMGIKSVDPTTDSNGNGIFTYIMPIATTDILTSTDLSTYTFEIGNNAECHEVEYCFAKTITLSGDAGSGLMMGGELEGRQSSTSTFTGSLSIPTVEEILFSKGSLYVDAVGDTIGDSQISNQFLSMSLSITTGWQAVKTGEGNLYFSFVKQVTPEILLEITFEQNTEAIAEYDYWVAETARQIRVRFDGSDASKYLILDMAGKWDNFGPTQNEQDGNDTLTGTFRAKYDSTAALFFEAVVGTGLASLP